MKRPGRLLNCILIPVLSFFLQFAQGQIIYTDVNPDKKVTDSFYLDLNNDGISDYDIFCHSQHPVYGCYTDSIRLIEITSLDSNEVGNNLYPLYFVSAVNFDETINDSAFNWLDAGNQLLLSVGACICMGQDCGWNPKVYGGNWYGKTDYVALRIHHNSKIYYGWLNLTVPTTGKSCKVIGYAYNSIPNQSILAGDTGKIATGIHNIKGFSSIAISPNVFQHLTSISFSLPKTEKVSIQIYDAQGRLIRILADQFLSQGENQLQWNATDSNENSVNAGIYFLKISSQDFSQTEKLMVVK